MTKIMLVEDDNNLREIYEARLLAEGYEIVSAKDGEEALATAVKEKPDLIISDVMMPKISGFDMLDILRSTPETKNTKVIMMTALSQAEDKARADKLGADKYLVKSQVTLEDVARVAAEVLTGEVKPASPEPAATPDPAPEVPAPAPVSPPTATVPDPTVSASPTLPTDTPDEATQQVAESATDELATVKEQITDFEKLPVAVPPTPAPTAVTPTVKIDETGALDTVDSSADKVTLPETPAVESIGVREAPTTAPAVETVAAPEVATEPVAAVVEEKPEGSGSSKRIIKPITDMKEHTESLNDLAAKEAALEAGKTTSTPVVINPADPAASTVISPTDGSAAL